MPDDPTLLDSSADESARAESVMGGDPADSAGVGAPGEYVVVARRYRPQAFTELVGQQHVAEALAGAIHSHRVGHAYLFTGARGVGKTSTARIFAKALNCVDGPTDRPCNECDICRSITAGDDVDVIEIDGASNRGIDDIRQLRQNVNVRPSRARFKIYIIDEVHMLSRDAFNALLKTLEEPPEHVKFIFCTTEPEKIPITILSRCQRFDFAGIETATIAGRLKQIVDTEGVEVDAEAIDLLARRAAGSMRDSQSLLEQILAAGGRKITIDDVQRLLGIAADTRLIAVVEHLVGRNAAGALRELDAAVRQGVDVGQLLDQLLGYLRDLMAASVGCPPEAFLYVSPSRAAEVSAAGPRIGVHTLLAMIQIAEQAASRLKQSTHGRTVVELALVRICALDELDDIAALVAEVNSGSVNSGSAGASAPAAPRSAAGPMFSGGSNPGAGAGTGSPVKKNIEAVAPGSREGVAAVPGVPTANISTAGASTANVAGSRPTAEVATKQQNRTAAASSAGGSTPTAAGKPVGNMPAASAPTTTAGAASPAATIERRPAASAAAPQLTAAQAQTYWNRAVEEFRDSLLGVQAGMCDRVTVAGPGRIVAHFSKKAVKASCERPESLSQLEKSISALAGGPVRIEFALSEEPVVESRVAAKTGPAPHERLREKSQQPFVRKALELFDARALRVEDGE
jgi:DNA polymerase-3 subunit gamma/tau